MIDPMISAVKTAAGTGRMIPLSRRICACLSLWLERFPEAGPDSFLFPYHKVGMGETHACRFFTTSI